MNGFKGRVKICEGLNLQMYKEKLFSKMSVHLWEMYIFFFFKYYHSIPFKVYIRKNPAKKKKANLQEMKIKLHDNHLIK